MELACSLSFHTLFLKLFASFLVEEEARLSEAIAGQARPNQGSGRQLGSEDLFSDQIRLYRASMTPPPTRCALLVFPFGLVILCSRASHCECFLLHVPQS